MSTHSFEAAALIFESFSRRRPNKYLKLVILDLILGSRKNKNKLGLKFVY